MPMYVIDASVLVADVRPQEPGHVDAHALLGQIAASGWVVYLPVIALAETASAISRATGRPDLARRLATALQALPYYRFVPVDGALGESAAHIAADFAIRGCDSVYVALARREAATLITLDAHQLERAPADVAARTPAEELARLRR
jgi:predicted nucleic acid-binding protein